MKTQLTLYRMRLNQKVADGIATVESDLSLSSLVIVRLASDRLSTKEKMIAAIVRRLLTDNEELQGYCANAIFKVSFHAQPHGCDPFGQRYH